MRRVAVFACIGLLWTGLASGPVRASCVAPSLSIAGAHAALGVTTVRAGSTVTIVGKEWFSSCNDTPSGCAQGGVSGPQTGIRVGIIGAARTPGAGWHPSGSLVTLGTADADAQFRFQMAGATMPTAPGRYLLVAATPGHEPQPYLHIIVTP